MTATQMLWGLIILQWALILCYALETFIKKHIIKNLTDSVHDCQSLLKEADMRLSLTMTAQREQIKRLQEDFDNRTQQMREKVALYEGLHGTTPTKKRI